ncbi:hypothetical protein AB0M80_08245 [Amycolatopsis sp. NPDC051045]|uniref:hypothetical protein n=1 Tax=Amycolatopsis sp. NPDC051045 TaxID=3156922 RepID=UPI003428CF97
MPDKPPAKSAEFSDLVLIASIVWTLIAVAAALLFTLGDGVAQRVAVAVMTLYAAAALGGIAGFLFGVPKSAPNSPGMSARFYQANTNLVQVSDWLTKIIVGVGLIEIRKVVDALGVVATRVGVTLGDKTGDPGSGATFVVLIILGGMSVSFLLTYMWASTRFYRVLLQQEESPNSPGITSG